MILPEPTRAGELRSVMPMVGQPGVHIEEIVMPPVIIGVDTAITAFVGRTARGPVDAPIPITSFVEFERVLMVSGPRATLASRCRTYTTQELFGSNSSTRLPEGSSSRI
jgi:phage tail sheath protein FI